MYCKDRAGVFGGGCTVYEKRASHVSCHHITFVCVYKCEYISSQVYTSLSEQGLCHRSSEPTKKTQGKLSHRVDAADRMWGYDGQWRNMCWRSELNPSYRWQVSVSVEADDRWHLTPLNIRSANITLVSMSCPIRIDCSTSTLLHGQVTAVSSSSLVMMMLHIDPITTVCCAE